MRTSDHQAAAGPEFYDNNAVFETYLSGRERRPDNPNNSLEKPVFDELAGDLTGLHILDLACGTAWFGIEALQQGCASYLGIDGSHNMIELAQTNLADTPGEVRYAPIEEWVYPMHQFDLVTCRLAFHYIQDIDPTIANIYQALVPGGRFIISLEHPVITSSNKALAAGGKRSHWIVDDYFETGERITNWMGGQVIKYHRTIEDYFMAFQKAGFIVEAVRESRPQRAFFSSEAEYERRKRIPLMLFFAALSEVVAK